MTTDANDLVDQLAAMFPVDGPHSDELTDAAVRGVADLVRFLNYATDRQTGTSYPGTVYNLLGSLRGALYGLDQTLRQAADRLTEHAADPHAAQSGPVSTGDRWPGQANPRDTAAAAVVNMHAARSPLRQAADAISDAQVYAGRLYINTPGD